MISTSVIAIVPALAAEATSGEAPSVFAGTIAQSIAAAMVFLILLGLLYKKAWGPILQGLQDREKRIKDDLEQAERSSLEADEKLTEYKTQLAEAHAESRKLLAEARTDAERIAAQLKATAKADVDQVRQRAQQDINAAKEQAINEIYAQTASLATQVAGRILQREIRPEDQQQLIEESLQQFRSDQSN